MKNNTWRLKNSSWRVKNNSWGLKNNSWRVKNNSCSLKNNSCCVKNKSSHLNNNYSQRVSDVTPTRYTVGLLTVTAVGQSAAEPTIEEEEKAKAVAAVLGDRIHSILCRTTILHQNNFKIRINSAGHRPLIPSVG